MPLIKPRTRGKHFARFQARLERENYETLCAYAAFIGESPEYVVNEAIENLLGRDRDYLAWRAEHPDSYAPPPATTPPRADAPSARADGHERDARETARLASTRPQ